MISLILSNGTVVDCVISRLNKFTATTAVVMCDQFCKCVELTTMICCYEVETNRAKSCVS